jgi:malonyl-CoA O-methyltransferase
MTEKTISLAVAEAYDRWSGFYDGYDNPLVFAADQVVQRHAGDVSGLSVFEFGCGTGRNLRHFKRGGAASLTGCDISAGMLAQAHRRDAGFALLQHDMARKLPLGDGSMDFALFALSLEHVGNLVPPLREAARLLRPGGGVAIVEIHPFFSGQGGAAHFKEGEILVQMPVVAHRFCDYLNAAAAAGLAIDACREWLPRDFQGPVPEKLLKRGPDFPVLVEFLFRR